MREGGGTITERVEIYQLLTNEAYSVGYTVIVCSYIKCISL